MKSGDNAATLSDRIMREGEWAVLCRAVTLYCGGKLHVVGGRVVIDED